MLEMIEISIGIDCIREYHSTGTRPQCDRGNIKVHKSHIQHTSWLDSQRPLRRTQRLSLKA